MTELERAERRKDYQKYIGGTRWQSKRQEAFKCYGRKCNRCENVDELQVHHKTYENFKEELMSDLEILCRKCHVEEHGTVFAADDSPEKPLASYVLIPEDAFSKRMKNKQSLRVYAYLMWYFANDTYFGVCDDDLSRALSITMPMARKCKDELMELGFLKHCSRGYRLRPNKA